MQQVHRALLEQAAGTWPLIFEKGSRRIQTCDHNVNGSTLSNVLELRDSPSYYHLYTIAALFDDVDVIRHLPSLNGQRKDYWIDKCGKSVVEFLFDQLEHNTQIVQAVLHRKFDLLLPRTLGLHTVGRILSIRDDAEIRQCILSAGFVKDHRMQLVSNVSTESVQWLLDQGVECRYFNLRQLWGTDRFEEAATTSEDEARLCDFTDCGLEVVLDLAARFPHWDKSRTLYNFIIGGDEAAVHTLWEDHFEYIRGRTHMFDLNATKWILSLCDQRQLQYFQQQLWICYDLEVAKYLHSKGFVSLAQMTLQFKPKNWLFESEADTTIEVWSDVSVAVLAELYTLGYRSFQLSPHCKHDVPVIRWVAGQSGLPTKVQIAPTTTQQQRDWVHSHYVFDTLEYIWTIKK